MYSTCLYCHAGLGSNEVIESFQVGRRLAFDAEKGRLWVVCPRCGRWNLTPLEERWEAVEACERRFRGTVLRASTDNVGLTRLPEGLELVRVGKPLRPELAAWRYGTVFRRRMVRAWLYAGGYVAAAGAMQYHFLLGTGMGSLLLAGMQFGNLYNLTLRPVLRLPAEDGTVLRFTSYQARNAKLVPDSAHPGWALHVGHKGRGPAVITGAEALSTIGLLLPWINREGASARTVADAARRLEEARTPASLFASVRNKMRLRIMTQDSRGTQILTLPKSQRLAMEIAAHEDAERRAMEGELAELERAWREAEEIAAIADNLLLPQSVAAFLKRLS